MRKPFPSTTSLLITLSFVFPNVTARIYTM